MPAGVRGHPRIRTRGSPPAGVPPGPDTAPAPSRGSPPDSPRAPTHSGYPRGPGPSPRTAPAGARRRARAAPSAGLRTGFGPYDRSKSAIRGPRGTGGSGDGPTKCAERHALCSETARLERRDRVVARWIREGIESGTIQQGSVGQAHGNAKPAPGRSCGLGSIDFNDRAQGERCRWDRPFEATGWERVERRACATRREVAHAPAFQLCGAAMTLGDQASSRGRRSTAPKGCPLASAASSPLGRTGAPRRERVRD